MDEINGAYNGNWELGDHHNLEAESRTKRTVTWIQMVPRDQTVEVYEKADFEVEWGAGRWALSQV